MVCVGANPINSIFKIEDDQKFLIGNECLSIKRANTIFKAKFDYIFEKRTKRVS